MSYAFVKKKCFAFVIITDQHGESVYSGVQIDGGKDAKQYAKEHNYTIRIWDMGEKLHINMLSDSVQREIQSELKAVQRRSR
jgi:hypothetical protein